MQNPVISVIVASFNSGPTIQRCIESVLLQTYLHKELIIIDGGSTDSSIEILKSNDDKIFYWDSKPDRGIFHAWNRALNHIRGDWINILGADDYLWQPDVLNRMVPHLVKAYPAYRVVYGRVNVVNERGQILYSCGQPWHKIKKRFLQCPSNTDINHQGVFVHRDLFRDHGIFDECLPHAGDYELLLRELKSSNAFFVPELIVAGQQHGGVSTSLAKRLERLREARMATSRNGIRVWPYLRHWMWLKTLIKLSIAKIFGNTASNAATDIYRKLTGRPPIWNR